MQIRLASQVRHVYMYFLHSTMISVLATLLMPVDLNEFWLLH